MYYKSSDSSHQNHKPTNQPTETRIAVGSRILESDQPAVHFSQDLNHFSVGQNRHRPPNNINASPA
jgi:hypothetical protein